LLLILPQGTPLRLDPSLGFHFYGADLCLQAVERGLATVAIKALCSHNSRGVELPPEFKASGRAFAEKGAAQLPLKTPCAGTGRDWRRMPRPSSG
jgi:hypothetical protein